MTEIDWAILARLVRPQGRHGEILADIFTDFPGRFAERKRLFLLPAKSGSATAREMTLERHWLHKGRVVLKFAGVDSINDAELLRGLDVAIPASERAQLTDGAVYISDLVGCEVFDVTSTPALIGTVTDVDAEAPLLILRSKHSGEILIPFVKAYLVNVDPATKRIEMRLPAGLLDINAPLSSEERSAMETADESD